MKITKLVVVTLVLFSTVGWAAKPDGVGKPAGMSGKEFGRSHRPEGKGKPFDMAGKEWGAQQKAAHKKNAAAPQ